MPRELEELKELTRQLKRRVQLSDSSDWLPDWVLPAAQRSVGPRPAAAAAPAAVPAPKKTDSGVTLSFDALAKEIQECRACPLGKSRIQAVPGVGSANAQVMFIGEGPGFEEDHRGEPFVGKSGQLLDKIMESIGLSRATVYIANIVKCHPMTDPTDPEKRGNDRPPTPEEIEACRGWLDRQICSIRPRFIVTLGNVPARVLLNTTEGITTLRGKWQTYRPSAAGPSVRLLPTFHPAALLRNPNLKREVWTDMKSLREELSK